MQGVIKNNKHCEKRCNALKKFVAALLVCISFLIPTISYAADSSAGKVLRSTGRATVTTMQGEIRQIVRGTVLNSTDMVSTSARSYVRLKMEDRSYVMVRPDSRIKISKFIYNKKTPAKNKSFYQLMKGGFRSVTGLIQNKKRYRYKTGLATIGIRGTEFSVRVCEADCYDIDPVPKNGLFLQVHEDTVILTTKAGEYAFTKGQFAYVDSSDSPAILLDGIPDVFDQSPIPAPEPNCKQ